MAQEIEFPGSFSQQVPFQRDTIFLSHANPEDNEFTLWLALQLASEGYAVWCDLTKLLGGEVFWDNIEIAIRKGTAKFLYVLSKTSNIKDGPLRELHLAQSVARKSDIPGDFVIPLHIDDLPYSEVTIELTRVNSIVFDKSWARGLKGLLKKLEEDNVPKKTNFSPSAVSSWWRMRYSAEHGIIGQADEHLSNWFPISNLPETIYYHSLQRTGIGKVEVSPILPYPAVQDGTSLISFARASDFEGQLGDCLYIDSSKPYSLHELLDGKGPKSFNKHFSEILRLAWEAMIEKRQLPVHLMANQKKCFYFILGTVKNDTIYFDGVSGIQTYRSVVGYKTITNPKTKAKSKRFWHFGVQAKPILYPTPVYVIKTHVLFSNDGKMLWDSKRRLAAARRNQCKGWWNDEWRDRILATMSWLAGDEEVVTVLLASDAFLNVPKTPFTFESPVSYLSPKEKSTPAIEGDGTSDEDREEDDEDDEEEEE